MLNPKIISVSSEDYKMCSQLQRAMEDMIKVFYCYSGKEGDKYKLNKSELKIMLQEELTDFLKVSWLVGLRVFMNPERS